MASRPIKFEVLREMGSTFSSKPNPHRKGSDFLIFVGHCPRACQAVDEQPTRKTFEWIPILEHQPSSPPKRRTKVVAREPIVGILLATISRTQGRLPLSPHPSKRKRLRRALWGKGKRPRRIYSPRLIAHIAIHLTTSAPPSDPSNNPKDALTWLATLRGEVLAIVRHNTFVMGQKGMTPVALLSHSPPCLLQKKKSMKDEKKKRGKVYFWVMKVPEDEGIGCEWRLTWEIWGINTQSQPIASVNVACSI